MKKFICFISGLFIFCLITSSDMIHAISPGTVFNPKANMVVFYEHSNYNGDFFAWTFDRDLANFKGWYVGSGTSKTWNDQVSSFKVGKNACVTFWKDSQYRGSKMTYNGNGSGIRSVGHMPSGWNDQISSAKIRMRGNCAR